VPGIRPDREDLLAEMARLGLRKALVRHVAALDAGPTAANAALMEETAGHPELLPVWFVTPDGQEPDFNPADVLNDMLAGGGRACWTDPKSEDFSFLPWCCGPLHEELQSRRIPLLLPYEAVAEDDLDIVLSAFPKLRIILLNAPRTGRNRKLYPLLRRHGRLHLCLSPSYSVHDGIEDLCRTFGHERWVFGTGYPGAEGGAAVTGLMYAAISDEARIAIAYGNIKRLLGEVKT
jgi:hypothetical protein